MPIPTFAEYHENKEHDLAGYHRKILNIYDIAPDSVSGLYYQYACWLRDVRHIEYATVSELLFQLKVISCFVEKKLAENQLNNESVTPELTSKINSAFDTLVATINDAAPKNDWNHEQKTIRWRSRHEINYNILKTLAALALTFIGAGFAPTLSPGGAIALWAIGSVIAAFTVSMCWEPYDYNVKSRAFDKIKNPAVDLATDQIATALEIKSNPETLPMIKATLNTSLPCPYTLYGWGLYEQYKKNGDKVWTLDLQTNICDLASKPHNKIRTH